ncbi:hypothetical protein K470DRAFT_156093 [Piedraia hortae CBS 480.64]|uniref:Uncharacterized protein n=1 Tax=Piedraia hortae CBS 480.64 TaxID=1314780 RepID=A0A6A7C7T4_9PEZI|nr:hypothetical protein K470DRAFT_156093 [Piedraia hortae CBS 480.64]
MSSRSETSDDYVLVNSEDGGVGELPTPAEAKDATNETVKFDAGSDAANVVDSGEKAHDDVKDGSQHSEKDGKDDGRKEATSDCQDNVTDRDEKVDAEKVEIEVKDDSKKTENEGINEDDDLEVKYQHLLKLVDQMKVDNDRLNEKLSDLRSKALTDRRADEEKEILYNESLIWREKLEKGLEYYKDKCKRLEEKYQRDMSSVSGNHAAAEKRLRQNTNDHRDEVAQLKKKQTLQGAA